LQSPELEALRQRMAPGGLELKHNDGPGPGPKILVFSEHLHAVRDFLERRGVDFGDAPRVFLRDMKKWHLVVEEEWDETLLRVIREWPGSGIDGGNSRDKVKTPKRKQRIDVELPRGRARQDDDGTLVISSKDEASAASTEADSEEGGEGAGEGGDGGGEGGGQREPDQGRHTDDVAARSFVDVSVPTSLWSGPTSSSKLTVSDPGPRGGGLQPRVKRTRFATGASQPQSQSRTQSQSLGESSGSLGLSSFGQVTLDSQDLAEIDAFMASLPSPDDGEHGNDGVDGSVEPSV